MKKIFLIIVSLLIVWSIFVEPNLLTVKTLDLHVKGLSGLKVVFVGDFHVKPYQKKRLTNVVKKINEQNPDLILTTGDFVSSYNKKFSMSIKDIAKELSKLRSKYGVYAVLGNHDWKQGGEEITRELQNIGFVVLGNENKFININGKKLYIAGVEDLTTRTVKLDKALEKTSQPTILLTHSPDVFPFITKKVDLTLAGHTHGGQIVLLIIGPPIVPSDYGKKYAQGLIVENNKIMFVTKGIGTSILPVRFNCMPEIVIINFT